MRLHVRLAAAGLIAVSAAATGQGMRPALIDQLLPGRWILHDPGSGTADRAICIRDLVQLLQIHHGTTACTRFTVSEDSRTATVNYTCPKQGHGRTVITVDGPSRVRIQTQGIVAGAPFDADYEARRGGPCLGSDRN